MTGPLGFSSGYKYESVEARALGGITRESYDYRDQGKLMSKLTGDVSYMAAYMRKMQKGIDDANQNFIQQIQSFINDIIVIFGGGGDTGLDFGDLKYILQAIGALFGFDTSGGLPLPLNLFSAAWHFFFNYIFPLENFREVIEMLVDGIIATVLDLFGEVPIIGQALQQLAVFIVQIRDALSPLITALENLFEAIGGNLASGDLGIFGPLIEVLNELFGAVTAPLAAALAPLWPIIGTWTVPFVQALSGIVDVVANLIEIVTGGINSIDDLIGAFNPLAIINNIVNMLLGNGLLGILSPLNALNLFGVGNLFGLLNIGNLNNRPKNMLDNGAFKTAISLSGGGIWTWDNTDGRTIPGVAKVTANGTIRQLVSNTVEVAEGDIINVEVFAKWSGLTYTGTQPIKLQLVQLLYDEVTENYATMDTVTVAGPASPGATQSTWLEFDDEITIEEDITHIALQLTVDTNATAGTIKFDDASLKKIGGIKIPWVDQLPESLQEKTQQLIDMIRGMFGSLQETGSEVPDAEDFDVPGWIELLQGAITTIPWFNVLGPGGPASIGESLMETWNQWVSGAVGVIGDGAELADLFTVSGMIASMAALGEMAFAQLGFRANKTLQSGFLPTSESNINLGVVAITPGPVTVSQANSRGEFHRFNENGLFGVVSWQGYGNSSISDFRVLIWKMNTTTGIMDIVHVSPDIKADLAGGTAYLPHVYEFDMEDIQREMGDVFAAELCLVGAGTHTVMGGTSIIGDQLVYPRKFAFSRNTGTTPGSPPSTLTPTYTDAVPFIEFGVSMGENPVPRVTSRNYYNKTDIDETEPVTSWAHWVDITGVGAGRGGGGSVFANPGSGGGAGDIAIYSLEVGVDIKPGTLITMHHGAPGHAGGIGAPGGPGGDTIITYINMSDVEVDLVFNGGVGIRPGAQGQAVGSVTGPDGFIYRGGIAANYSHGAKPGGGGSGGLPYNGGYWGAGGASWITQRQA